MRQRRRTALIAGGAAFVAVLVLGFGAAGGGDYLRRAEPAPPGALEQVKARNEKAAIESAARMRAESEARAEATDAELARTEAAQGR